MPVPDRTVYSLFGSTPLKQEVMLAAEIARAAAFAGKHLSLPSLPSKVVRRSKLHLVDLAGSERAGPSENTSGKAAAAAALAASD